MYIYINYMIFYQIYVHIYIYTIYKLCTDGTLKEIHISHIWINDESIPRSICIDFTYVLVTK